MQPIDKGLPEPELLAQVAVSKYGDHIPLHRQEEIYQRQGGRVIAPGDLRLDAGVGRSGQPALR